MSWYKAYHVNLARYILNNPTIKCQNCNSLAEYEVSTGGNHMYLCPRCEHTTWIQHPIMEP